eukprot:306449_1
MSQKLFYVFILFLLTVYCTDDFIGSKYVAFNNITTTNFASSHNYTIILSPDLIKYENNPLFIQDRPWEVRIDNGYPNIIYSPETPNKNKTFQLWYADWLHANPHIEGTCYAESNDGINFIKPNLGIIEFNGTKNNNIVFKNCGGLGIWKDIYTKNESERYKAFGTLTNSISGTAVSPNGIYNWSDFRQLSLNNRYDTHNNMFFDINKTNKYIAVTRGIEFPPRTVAISDSKNNLFNSSFRNVSVVESGGNINQTYAQITFKYYGIYLGLVMIFDSNTTTQRVFCELSYSTDLVQWYRINPGKQLIPLSPLSDNAFDSYICFSAAYPIVYNNRIRLYYFGGNGPHNGPRNSSFALATIRLDGFAGITNDNNKSKIAMIETYELLINGKYFIVNIDIKSQYNSYAKIGLKNINGFQLNDSDTINGNVTDYVVSWNGKQEITNLIGKNVIIQFELYQSILYTFNFVNDSQYLFRSE